MHKAAELMRLLADWRRLTEAEGRAISGGNWSGVADQQAQKLQLQQEITRVLEQPALISGTEEGPCSVGQAELHPLVRDLMALEIRNRNLVVAKREDCQPESQRLARSVRHLQVMRRAYGVSSDPRWESYS